MGDVAKMYMPGHFNIADYRPHRVDGAEVRGCVKISAGACGAIQKPCVFWAEQLQMAATGAAFVTGKCHLLLCRMRHQEALGNLARKLSVLPISS